MEEEGWQTLKAKTIKTSINKQRSAINKIARQLGVEKFTYDEVCELGFG
jgi:hypothetical protein